VALIDLDRLVTNFCSTTLPKADWTHAAHLTIGMWHAHRYGPDEALSRLRVGIRRLNDRHGTINSTISGYHETITRAYVQLLSQFLKGCPQELPFLDRLSCLLGSQLADKTALVHFYSGEVLASASARAEWLEPDLAPLNAEAVLGMSVGDYVIQAVRVIRRAELDVQGDESVQPTLSADPRG